MGWSTRRVLMNYFIPLWWPRQRRWRPKYADHEQQYYTRFPLDELPMDVTENILQRLSLGDRLRMSAVCRSWKHLLMSCDSNCIRPSPEIPWLLIPKSSVGKEKGETIRFRSMSDDKIYGLKVPKPISSTHLGRGWCCCGSSNGWLIMSNEATNDFDLPMNLFLLNPITGATLNLPDLRTTPYAENFYCHLPSGSSFAMSMIKVVAVSLAADHDGVPDYSSLVVAAIIGQNPYEGFEMNVLAICKPQADNAWIMFGASSLYLDHHRYGDILFYNGKLVVVMYCDGVDIVNVHDIAPQSQKDCDVKLEFECIGDDGDDQVLDEWNMPESFCFCAYLVQSIHGELMVVTQCCQVLNNDNDEVDPVLDYKTMEFRVYKKCNEEEVHSLDEQVIFLASRGGSTCVPARNFDSRFRGNHIYFASRFCSDSPQVGVYDLINKQLLLRVDHHPWPTCWFTPSYGNCSRSDSSSSSSTSTSLQMLPRICHCHRHERNNAAAAAAAPPPARTYGYMDTCKYVIKSFDRAVHVHSREIKLIGIFLTLIVITMRTSICGVLSESFFLGRVNMWILVCSKGSFWKF